jgi:hypothetical protein
MISPKILDLMAFAFLILLYFVFQLRTSMVIGHCNLHKKNLPSQSIQ